MNQFPQIPFRKHWLAPADESVWCGVRVGMKAMTQPDNIIKPIHELDCELEQQNVELEDGDASTAAQMEWDPQTDVASPMLPLPGATYIGGPSRLTQTFSEVRSVTVSASLPVLLW